MPRSFNDPPVGGDALTDAQINIIATKLKQGFALGVADPTSTGVSARLGSIGYNTGTPPVFYLKVDTPDTSWEPLGSTDLSGRVLVDLSNINAGALLGDIELKDYSETVVTNSSVGATYDIDLSNANVYDLTLTANTSFTFSNPPASGKSGSITLVIRQDATGNRVPTWPAAVIWNSGFAAQLSTGANEIDVLTFFTLDSGTTWFGFVGGLNFS